MISLYKASLLLRNDERDDRFKPRGYWFGNNFINDIA
jgi:hypothetical protein